MICRVPNGRSTMLGGVNAPATGQRPGAWPMPTEEARRDQE